MQRFNRAQVVDRNFVRFVKEWKGPAPPTPDPTPEPPDSSGALRQGYPLTGEELLELFDSQMTSRHLDLTARELRARDQAYYTISSSGHEGNAVIGRLTRHTDPAFLHYRSGALMVERARKLPGQNIIRDTLLGMSASADDPVSGGRHKAWGGKALWVLPQTSTVASHLPKSVGAAMAIARMKRLGLAVPVPQDSIVICSFGDAGTQHAAAQTAINAACNAAFSRLPVPILFVCEDNGLGISVHTAPGWVEAGFSRRPGLQYYRADGLDIVEAHAVATEAVQYCRQHRAPVFLHLRVVRLLGHAGTDFEFEYHTIGEIEAAETQDPLLATAGIVMGAGLLRPEEVLERYEAIRERVRQEAANAISRPKLATAAQVTEPLAPYHPDRVRADATALADRNRRIAAFGGQQHLPEDSPPRHLAVQINRALFDLMAKYDDVVLFGEDVARKGGVYYVTKGLQSRFGAGRVFNTLLDETMILGLGQGFGSLGLLPIAEIQYLAYVHNAADQLRGEACSLQYFSRDQFRNPLVVRIASFGYQKGFGGHFHNDNSIAALRDIPGLIIAVPSRGDDAAGMLRTAVSLARVDGRVVAFLEPIALYMTKDLHQKGDGGWLTDYPSPDSVVALGSGRVYAEEATDLAIITYGNGVYYSLRAAKRLEREHGIRARVIDLRWLNPLNVEMIAHHAGRCGRALIVDEGRRTGGVAEAVVAAIVEGVSPLPRIERVTGLDTYIPLGPAARLVLPGEDDIVQAARRLCD